MEQLRRLTKVHWAPDTADWWKTGILIQRIGDAHDWDRRKRLELLAKELKVRVLMVQA